MGRSGSNRLSRKGSLYQGGIDNAGGEEGVVVNAGGGGVGLLRSGASEIEM